MEPSEHKVGIDADELRRRNLSQHASSSEMAQAAVKELNSDEAEKDRVSGKEKKTFGRTPDGTSKQNLPDSAACDWQVAPSSREKQRPLSSILN